MFVSEVMPWLITPKQLIGEEWGREVRVRVNDPEFHAVCLRLAFLASDAVIDKRVVDAVAGLDGGECNPDPKSNPCH